MGSDRGGGSVCPKPRDFVDTKTGEVIRAPCGGWGCPSCGKKRQAELAHRARMAMTILWDAYEGKAQFLTLTLDPKRNRASAANGTKLQARYISRCWRRLISKWRERCRRSGRVPPWYLKISEWRSLTDAMHLHVIFLGWLPSSTGMKEDIVSAGFGKVFDIQPVQSVPRLTRYVTKYVTKTASQGAPRYVHRYSASRGAMPPLVLWKRLRVLGFVQSLKDAAEGKPWFFARERTAWWTGEQRAEIEHALDGMEAVREITHPKRNLKWIRPEQAWIDRTPDGPASAA